VELEVPPTPAAAVSPAKAVAPALNGPQGCVRGSFVVSVKAAGVRRVTFYLDGHKLKTMSAKNVRQGKFSISINGAKLRVGVHRVAAKIQMTSGTSGLITRRLTILRCASAAVVPKFTG
jgi:hypothetical protein